MDSKIRADIDSYLGEILKVNEHINLTRIEDSDEARLLHIEDSLVALPELERAPEGRYVDLGSGGGFPGVPLGIASGRKTLLVDSVKKKMNAVAGVLEELGLDNQISTYGGRIEELSIEQPQKFSVATARALSQLSILLELASPLLKKGGHLICYKAQLSDEEYNKATKLQSYLGMKLISDRSLLLSDNVTNRRILVFEKVKQPGLKLPRKIGFAQKRPLS